MIKKLTLLCIIFVLFIGMSFTTNVQAGNNYKNATYIKKSKVTNNYINDVSSLTKENSSFMVYYKNFTEFFEETEEAISAWASLDMVEFHKAHKNISLFIVEEFQGPNNFISSYIVDGIYRYIVLNNFYFDNLTYEEKVYVITHELGHALGLVDLPNREDSSSVMEGVFDTENSNISLLDILLLNEVVNSEDSNFGYEYYSSNSNICLAYIDSSSTDQLVCPGPGGGGSSSSSTPSIADQVIAFTEDLQDIIDAVSSGNVASSYDEFLDLYPSDILIDHEGACAIGVYTSIGGLWLGGTNLLPIGGSLGLQFVHDSYGNLAIQVFIGAGIHLLPHADVIAYGMYYFGDVHYTDLEGFSGQMAAEILIIGPTAEYVFNGDFWGLGISKSIFSLDLGLIDINIIAEIQYTATIYAGQL